MAAPGGRGEVRVRLTFEYPPPALPQSRHLWFMLDTELCRAVTDVSAIIRERFFYSRRGTLSLYLDGCLLPPGESVRLIRDNDAISVKWEEISPHDSPHRPSNKRRRSEDGSDDCRAPERTRGVHRGAPEERRVEVIPEVSKRPKKKKKKVGTLEEEEVSGRPKKKVVTPEEEEVSGRPKKKVVTPEEEEVSGRPKKKVGTPEEEEVSGRPKKKVGTPEEEEVSGRPKKKVGTLEEEEVSGRPKKKVGTLEEEEVSGRPKKKVVTPEEKEVSGRPKKKVGTLEEEEVSGRPKKKVVTPEEKEVSGRPKKKKKEEEEEQEVSEWPKKVRAPQQDTELSAEASEKKPKKHDVSKAQYQEKAPPPASTVQEKAPATRKRPSSASSSSSEQEDTGAPLNTQQSAGPSSPDTFIIKKPLMSGRAISPPVYNGRVARGGGQQRPSLRIAGCGLGWGRGIDHPPLRGWGFRGRGQVQPQNHFFYNYSPETIKQQQLNEDVSNVSRLIQNPPQVHKDYSDLPLLAAPPQPGKIIAFKLLELTENYTPEVSDYKEGRILSYDPVSQQLEVEVLSQQKKKEPGKFDLVYEGEDGTDIVEYAVPQECKITQAWNSLIEPRLVTEHGPQQYAAVVAPGP